MLSALTPLSKHLQYKSIHIHDTAFLIHSRCTMVILLTCSVLLSARQYFGDPIQCISTDNNINYVQAYCWTMGTYVLKTDNLSHLPRMPVPPTSRNGRERISMRRMADYNEEYARAISIAEGVGPEIRGQTQREYLRYYQWVIIMLMFESFVFYFPSCLWRLWEGNRLQQLCSDLNEALLWDQTYKERLELLVDYFTSNYVKVHFRYMAKYVFCELLNFIISIGNIMALEIFLNGFWSKYLHAIAAIPFNDWDRWNHISSQVFPKVAKCEVLKYGPSGTVNIMDNLCILPLNILNEKIFVCLWCWFLLMATISGLSLLLRLATICSGSLRLLLIRSQLHVKGKEHVKHAVRTMTIGDWFILMKVSANVNPLVFGALLEELSMHRSRNISSRPIESLRESYV